MVFVSFWNVGDFAQERRLLGKSFSQYFPKRKCNRSPQKSQNNERKNKKGIQIHNCGDKIVKVKIIIGPSKRTTMAIRI